LADEFERGFIRIRGYEADPPPKFRRDEFELAQVPASESEYVQRIALRGSVSSDCDFNCPAETVDWAAYDYLRLKARMLLQKETLNHGWEPTDLLHEAFLRMARSRTPIRFQDRGHFYAVAQLAMRRILIDSARSARAGGAVCSELLNAESKAASSLDPDRIVIRDALYQLATQKPRTFTIVQMRFYWGFELDEIGAALSLSTRTIKRELLAARLWLRNRLAQTAMRTRSMTSALPDVRLPPLHQRQ
jgi:RNA polymerase sigma factor (TIGR02999 family)